MTEFWENSFKEKQEMWGLKPTKSALLAKDLFIKKGIRNILIPGMGYGRNAKVFKDNGFDVTGIEISKTAIELARKYLGQDMTIYHDTVSNMPLDSRRYDGIFCHALVHLLDKEERQKLILDCYDQLIENGYMIFTAITKTAPNYGKGRRIGQDRFEFHQGAKLFYYDEVSVQEEFSEAGLFKVEEIKEDQPLYFIKCQKIIDLKQKITK